MTISNNYIFLRKPQTKEIKKVNNNDENIIVVDIGQSVASSIEKIFPDALKAEADARERFVSKYNYSVESGTNAYQIEFIVMEVVNSTYLTVKSLAETMKDFYSKVMPQLTTTAKSFAEVITKISINPSITSNLVNIVKVYRDVYRDAFCIMTQADDENSDRQLEFDGENNEDINKQ